MDTKKSMPHQTRPVLGGLKCGECLMERVEIVALVDGVCPKCGAYAVPKAGK